MNDKIYHIEKKYLKRIQGKLDRLLNIISLLDRKLSNTELKEIIILNNSMTQLENDISNIEINLLKNIPNRKLSYNMKQSLDNSEHADQIINKFLPYMLLSSISS